MKIKLFFLVLLTPMISFADSWGTGGRGEDDALSTLLLDKGEYKCFDSVNYQCLPMKRIEMEMSYNSYSLYDNRVRSNGFLFGRTVFYDSTNEYDCFTPRDHYFDLKSGRWVDYINKFH